MRILMLWSRFVFSLSSFWCVSFSPGQWGTRAVILRYILFCCCLCIVQRAARYHHRCVSTSCGAKQRKCLGFPRCCNCFAKTGVSSFSVCRKTDNIVWRTGSCGRQYAYAGNAGCIFDSTSKCSHIFKGKVYTTMSELSHLFQLLPDELARHPDVERGVWKIIGVQIKWAFLRYWHCIDANELYNWSRYLGERTSICILASLRIIFLDVLLNLQMAAINQWRNDSRNNKLRQQQELVPPFTSTSISWEIAVYLRPRDVASKSAQQACGCDFQAFQPDVGEYGGMRARNAWQLQCGRLLV